MRSSVLFIGLFLCVDISRGVVHASELQPISVAFEPGSEIWRGDSWRKFGSYIAQNTPGRLGAAQSAKSRAFWGNKMFMNITGASIPNSPHNTRYIDAMLLYPNSIPAVRAFADKYGYDYESMFLHWNVNHSWNLSPTGTGGAGAGWTTGIAQFDVWDPSGISILTSSNGVVFTNVTSKAWTGGVSLTTSERELYIGSMEPFDDVFFTITAGLSGSSVVWEYWNGNSWGPAVATIDTTNQLATTGKYRFTPQANWSRSSLNGSLKKYWMRARITGSPSRWPQFSKIYGTDLRTGVTNSNGQPQYYGWCSIDNDRSHINTGLSGEYQSLEYEPNPPAECLGRFRWHGRALTVWQGNAIVKNVSNVQRGTHTWSHFAVEDYMLAEAACSAEKATCGFNGIFFDDVHDLNATALVEPIVEKSPAKMMTYTDVGQGAWMSDHMAAMYAAARKKLLEVCPTCKTSGNIGTWSIAKYGDVALHEIAATASGGTVYQRVNGQRIVWDQFRTDQQALTKDLTSTPLTQGLFGITSTVYDRSTANMWAPFDRGNQAPINALAMYYIHANENTALFYTGYSSAAFYDGKDNFLYWNEEPDAIAAVGRLADKSNTAKSIEGEFTTATWITPCPTTTRVKFGTLGEYLLVCRASNSHLTTTSKIWNTYPAGTGIWRIREGFLSTSAPPPVERIFSWGYWFPAMDVDLGKPNVSGWNNGRRWGNASASGGEERNNEQEWIRAANSAGLTMCAGMVNTASDPPTPQAGGCTRFTTPSVWRAIIRRDFTKATIVQNLGWNLTFSDAALGFASTYSDPLYFSGQNESGKDFQFPQAVMYPLRADGYTDNSMCNYTAVGGKDYRTQDGGCTAIRLRASESAILMKAPIQPTAPTTVASETTDAAQARVSVSVFPAEAVSDLGKTTQFTAAISGLADQSVIWAVNGIIGGNPDVGTVTATGIYTAPSLVPAAAIQVTAISKVKPAVSASASVQIASLAPPVILSRDPAAAGEGLVTITLNGGGFDKGAVIKVNGTAWPTTWVSPYRISATSTMVAGTYTITATNPGDHVSTATSITVHPLTVAISPASAILRSGATQQFTATVSYSADKRVTWAVDGVVGGNSTVGVISSTGLYTAPIVKKAGSVVVSAVSLADTTKSSSVKIELQKK
jgi:hypothetical protein